MSATRWVAVLGVLALGGALSLRGRERPPPRAPVVHAGAPSLALVVAIDGQRLDLERLSLRLTPTRHEEPAVEHHGVLGADGRFHVSGLADTDYRVELVVRADPSLVLARADFIRPRGELLRLAADLAPAQALRAGAD